ncbi:MAG: hypothetical protein IPK78_20670 [Rhodospirillales bacterium]|nr:hypothetical protein [Rhodospirillales bacterium]
MIAAIVAALGWLSWLTDAGDFVSGGDRRSWSMVQPSSSPDDCAALAGVAARRHGLGWLELAT